jgi:TfoX/Sxy family transcriptional regulator of competence genes
MATKQSTADFILDQAVRAGHMSARKMFGNYALYCDGKVVGLICNEALFIKITESGKKFVGDYYQEGYAYEGAKISMAIDEESIEDKEWLSELIRITADSLPAPKLKNKK